MIEYLLGTSTFLGSTLQPIFNFNENLFSFVFLIRSLILSITVNRYTSDTQGSI